MTLTLRTANQADIPALLAIERASFAQPHWRMEDFLKYRCLVAQMGDQIAGFLITRDTYPGDPQTPPEREILNLAVAARFRRAGVATALLSQELSSKSTYFLEVRESNTSAQLLYKQFGFREVGRRPGYYSHPPETAIVMQMK